MGNGVGVLPLFFLPLFLINVQKNTERKICPLYDETSVQALHPFCIVMNRAILKYTNLILLRQ